MPTQRQAIAKDQATTKAAHEMERLGDAVRRIHLTLTVGGMTDDNARRWIEARLAKMIQGLRFQPRNSL